MNDFNIGIVSGIISSFICNPLDVIRVHSQTDTKIKLNKYNINFLYRGISNTLITIPTFWSIYFPVYNKLKENNYKISAGYISSCLASTIVSPLFFIKQHRQLNENFNIINYYNKYGIKPFYSGLIPTYIVNMSFFFQMPIYEFLKKKICENKNNNKYYLSNILLFIIISKTIATSITYPFDTIRAIKRNNIKLSYNKIIKNLNCNYLNYYKGFSIYLMRSLPYHSTVFCVYEFLKKKNN